LGKPSKVPKKLAEMMAGKARLLSDVIEKALTSDEELNEDSTLQRPNGMPLSKSSFTILHPRDLPMCMLKRLPMACLLLSLPRSYLAYL
jgi:hypothetical protein